MENQAQDVISLAVRGRISEILPNIEFYLFASPIFLLLLGALTALLTGVFKGDPEKPSFISFGIAMISCSAAVLASVIFPAGTPVAFLGSGFLADNLSQMAFLVISLGTIFTLIAAYNTSTGRQLLRPELIALLLFSSAGMMIQASAGEFMSFFAGLEIMSVSLYVLVGYQRKDTKGLEAAIKYFLLGAGAAAVLLMGMALVYLHVGSMKWAHLAHLDPSPVRHPLAFLGVVMMVAGLCFKMALVPFHAWAPDIYQGAHSTLTGYMATLVKFSMGIVILRILSVGFGQSAPELTALFWILSALSIVVGSLFGLVHSSVKRILAYSSIANAGYLCVAFTALSANPGNLAAKQGFISYAIIYVILNLGAFAVLAWIEDGNREDLMKEELAGLGSRNPFAAASLSVFLLGLAGLPPLAGFIGKFFLVSAAVSEGFTGLAVILVLFSCISLFYYLSIIVQMWFRPATRSAVSIVESGLPGMKGIICAAVLMTFFVGIFGPRWAFNLNYKTAVETAQKRSQSPN